MDKTDNLDDILFLIEGTLKATFFYGMSGTENSSLQETIDRFLKAKTPQIRTEKWTVMDVKIKFIEWYAAETARERLVEADE